MTGRYRRKLMPMGWGNGQAAPEISDAIAIARVLCILGIVYPHAWSGFVGEALVARAQSGQGIFRLILVENFGRSGVPLLGMISGWLVAGSRRTGAYLPFVAGKARTILLPMVLWNILAVLLVSGSAWWLGLQAPRPGTLWDLVDELFCLQTPSDVNVQVAFLRDLFICMAVAPFLIRLPRQVFLAVLAGSSAWAIGDWFFPLVLRPQILLFFLFGIYARRTGLAERAAALPMSTALFPFLLTGVVKTWLSVTDPHFDRVYPEAFSLLDIATRMTAALFFWRLSCRLAETRLSQGIRRIEPFMFFMFCSHLIMIWLSGPLFARLIGPLGSPAYPPLLLLHPFLMLGLACLIGRLLILFTPRAADILSGGRLKDTAVRPLHRTLDALPAA